MLYEVMWTACSQKGQCFRVVRDGYEYSVETIICDFWERITERVESFHDALDKMNDYVNQSNAELQKEFAKWQG